MNERRNFGLAGGLPFDGNGCDVGGVELRDVAGGPRQEGRQLSHFFLKGGASTSCRWVGGGAVTAADLGSAGSALESVSLRTVVEFNGRAFSASRRSTAVEQVTQCKAGAVDITRGFQSADQCMFR